MKKNNEKVLKISVEDLHQFFLFYREAWGGGAGAGEDLINTDSIFILIFCYVLLSRNTFKEGGKSFFSGMNSL